MGLEERIRQTVEQYLATFSAGDREGWLDLFSGVATVEDPVGSPVRSGRQAIGEFWDGSHQLAEKIVLALVQGPAVVGNEAAFAMEARALAGGATMVIPTIDVMRFDDDGRIVSQRAFWDASSVRTES